MHPAQPNPSGSPQQKRFVIVSGLPGSGKSTLARQLAAALGLQLLDKDDILETLFDLKGTGGEARRRALSRESDAILQAEATASDGAVIVSHWHLDGMPAESGTPIEWLDQLPGKRVNVHCVCSPEVAAGRFIQRARHLGHCDSERTPAEVLGSIRDLTSVGRLSVETQVEVDTSGIPQLNDVLRHLAKAFDCAG